MKIMIVGGTGFIGYHTILAGLKHGHIFGSLSVDDIDLSGWYPDSVILNFGNVFEMTAAQLQNIFCGYEALVYAVGPDDRVVPPAPAYDFFHARLVDNCEKTITAALKAGIKRCVILNSYFAYFDRIWPQLKLSGRHPYIKCRVEQAERAVAAGKGIMDVIILELPYIFGSMPERTPLWKEVFLDKYTKGKTIFFPKGGTNMIAAEHVGEAVSGALERGRNGVRYTVGDENHTYREMLQMMMDSLGERKRITEIPRFAAVIAGIFIESIRRAKGQEGGLHAGYLMRDILTRKFYFNPEESAAELGYERGGLKESIEKTIRACYPERFAYY